MTTMSTDQRERLDLLQTLDTHRGFLRYTVRGLNDAQAAQRTTVSVLTLGGIIKHVAATEYAWMSFVLGGASGMASSVGDYENQFRMLPDETLDGLLARYDEVAERTTQIIRELPDLDAEHPLPEAPWFEKGAKWSARRVLIHILAETAQHAGHADIIRESLDGSKTMG